MLDTSNSAWLVYAPDNGSHPLCVCDSEDAAMGVALKMARFVDYFDEDETEYDAARKLVRFCPMVHGEEG